MTADRATEIAKRTSASTDPHETARLVAEYAQSQRAELNRQIDLLEANRKTPEEYAAEVARVQERARTNPGKPLDLEEFRRELGLPPRSADDPPRLRSVQVTVQCNGPGAGRAWIRWPDGETCEHPSLADARNCPKAVAS